MSSKKEPPIRLTRIARKLTFARIACDLTQAEVANELGISLDTIHSWETGRRVPTIPRLESWASAVRCQLDISPLA